MIARERARQREKEGWSAKHDDDHDGGELALAAACYVLAEPARQPGTAAAWLRVQTDFQWLLWPWDRDSWKPTPEDRIHELVKAGALIAAEIDRLQRAEEQRGREEGGDARGTEPCPDCGFMGPYDGHVCEPVRCGCGDPENCRYATAEEHDPPDGEGGEQRG